jgi:hypothetical protein
MTNRQPIHARVVLDRYCGRQTLPRVDYREGPLDGMLIGMIVGLFLGVAALLQWGGS